MHATQISGRPADISRTHGRAWTLHDLTQDGMGSWLLQCPGAHPYWDCWIVSLIHLRDLPSMPPARRETERATHEVAVFAIEPREAIAVDDPASMPLMIPPCIAWQAEALTDEQAQRLTQQLVTMCTTGALSPDSDGARYWAPAATACMSPALGDKI